MRKRIILFLISLCFLFYAFNSGTKDLFAVPQNWPQPEYDFVKNPLSEAKIELGRALFYDPILSRNNMVSCASCHTSYTAFAHVDHALSHGIEDRIGIRNAPALMNLAWHKSFMWDGAIEHLDKQSLFPITHPDEMGEKIEQLTLKLQSGKMYPSLFQKAYGDSNISEQHLLNALAQFMLTLVSANARYDSVKRMQSTFTTQENKGYVLFKKHCNACHTEPLFSNFSFENNGLGIDTTLNDCGRAKVSGCIADSFKFKVPTLRNIEFSFPYMHDGRFKKLSEVLNHYTTGMQRDKNLSKKLQKPILLSANDKADLISFLLTLTDRTFLFNPKHTFPKNIFYPPAQE